MLGGGVFVKQNKKLPGSFVNFQTNQQNDSSNNDCFEKGGTPDTCREVIEARAGMPNLKLRIDKIEFALESVSKFVTFHIDENGNFVIELPDSVWDIAFIVNENGELEVIY